MNRRVTTLDVEALSAQYGRIRVVRDFSEQLVAGEVLAVLGPNGAGKSSLLGAIAGIVAGSGRVTVNGHEVGDLPSYRRVRAGLALVPEVRGNLFSTLTVRQNLSVPRVGADGSGSREERIDLVLTLFPRLNQMLDRTCSALSGGEQQMVAIGMALMADPVALMLDEPSQGLAPAVLLDVAAAVRRLAETGISIMVTEQNHAFAADMADRYLVLGGGAITGRGTAADLSDREALAAAYLGEGA